MKLNRVGMSVLVTTVAKADAILDKPSGSKVFSRKDMMAKDS
jgi:hypothetical protein